MEDLSLHILDIAENSIRAGAKTVEIRVEEDPENDRLAIIIRDDGAGMDETVKRRALDPFFTTKEGKPVGLGLALLAEAARRAGGAVTIESERGRGTTIAATFQYAHVDRQPLGDMGKTVEALIVGNPDVEFVFAGYGPRGKWWLDTQGIRRALGAVPIGSGEGIRMIRDILESHGFRATGG
jgi:anti-sigma regulatory factor (Ser/Thr protein kinase)